MLPLLFLYITYPNVYPNKKAFIILTKISTIDAEPRITKCGNANTNFEHNGISESSGGWIDMLFKKAI